MERQTRTITIEITVPEEALSDFAPHIARWREAGEPLFTALTEKGGTVKTMLNGEPANLV